MDRAKSPTRRKTTVPMTWCEASGDPAPTLKLPRSLKGPWITAVFPTEIAAAHAPKGAEFVGAVAWSFRPGSERREGFFIKHSPRGEWSWVLWVFAWDDNWERWDWRVRACTTESFASLGEAASSLLRTSWTAERGAWNTTMFDEIEDDGLLSTRELDALGEETLGSEVRSR